MKKYEKITLYTAIETYHVDPKSPGALGVTALDYILPALEDSEVTILDFAYEDYKLIKVRKVSDG